MVPCTVCGGRKWCLRGPVREVGPFRLARSKCLDGRKEFMTYREGVTELRQLARHVLDGQVVPSEKRTLLEIALDVTKPKEK